MATAEVECFEGFYAGPENRAVVAAISAAAKKPGELFPLIYLYGQAGVGKRSLIAAYQRRLERARRSVEVFRFSGVGARADESASPDGGYAPQRRGTALLVVEEADRFGAQRERQRELRRLCDVAHRGTYQIIVTALVRPWALPGVESPLVNRFVAGLVLELRPPGLAARRALLESCARRHQIPLSAAAAQHLAESMPVTPAVLQQALLLLDDAARLEGGAITRELVAGFVAGSPPLRVSLEQIAAEVASHFEVSVRELRSRRRAQAVTMARRAAMYLARRLTDCSAEAIARYFHKRHASTVSHACRKLSWEMGEDAALREDLERLVAALAR